MSAALPPAATAAPAAPPAPPPASTQAGAPRQARDVMTFGQETGRVLSDGRIVGRAEPFAKVFASSRLVKQAVGLTAWGILEDIALDATLDAEGRLVAETSTRRIAANLAINRETVVRHLQRLREYGFVLYEETRRHGCYDTARYVLDPSACLERFTQTPGPASSPWSENPTTAPTVVGFSDHGKSDHGSLEKDVVVTEKQQQHHAAQRALAELGVEAATAATLAARYCAARIDEVVRAAPRHASRNPAGWAVRALKGDWAVADDDSPAPAPGWTPPPPEPKADPAVEAGWAGWDTAVSAALDDDRLARAARTAGAGLAPSARVGPALRARLIAWAAHTWRAAGEGDLAAALDTALGTPATSGPAAPVDLDLPDPPAATGKAPPLRARLAELGLATTRPPPAPKGGLP